MSSKDLLYTNKFSYDEIEDINDIDKETFKEQYEKKFGVPTDLLNNNNNNLNDYNIVNEELNKVKDVNIEKIEQKKNIKTLKKIKKSIVSIDSKDRDVTVYTSPSSFRINLPKKFSNINKIKLASTEFPNTEQVIRSQPVAKKNNKIYWKNYDDGNILYSITITDGNYTSSKFANELQNKMNSVERSGTDTLGVPHNFVVSVDAITNVFTIKQNLTSIISNPFTINKDSKVMTVNHFDHNYDTGQIITVSNSSRIGGLSTTLINTSHLISVDLKRIDSINWDSTNSKLIFTVGTVNYTNIYGTATLTDASSTGEITGKIKMDKGSRSITGIGTTFTSNSLVADKKVLHIGNNNYIIRKVNSNTVLTLETEALENYNGKDNLIVTATTYNNSTNKMKVSFDYIPSSLITRLGSGNISYNIRKYSDDQNVYSGTLQLSDVSYTYDKYKVSETMYFEVTVTGSDSNSNNIPDSIDPLIDLMTSVGSDPKAYLHYTQYSDDNITNFYVSRRTLGTASLTTGSSTITGSLDNYNINVNFNKDLSLIVLGGSGVNGFAKGETITGNASGATGKIVSAISADITNPFNLENMLTPYKPTIPNFTLPSSYTYTVSTGNYSYPPSTGNNTGTTYSRFKFTLIKTLDSNAGDTNIFESPKLLLIKGKTYIFNMDGNITSSNRLKFSTTNNGSHNSGSEFTHSNIVFDSGNNRYTITVSDSLISAIGSNKTLYYYSIQSGTVGKYLGLGGYLYIVDNTNDYTNNIGYGEITTVTSLGEFGRIYLNGRFLGAKKGTDASLTVMYAPKHGITYNNSDSTKNQITIFESSNNSRVNSNGYDYGLITSVKIPSSVNNGVFSDNIQIYSTGIADNIAVGDTIVIKSAETGFPYNGAFNVNSVVNDGTSNTLDHVTITTKAVYKNSSDLIWTINNGHASSITFYKGTGYVNGNTNHVYHQITSVLDSDHFVINYPYMGSEIGYWSEILTGSSSSSKAGCLGGFEINNYGTKFLTDYTVEDNIYIGNQNFGISKINNNNQIIATSNATIGTLSVNYKNVSAHTLETGENLSFMESKNTIDDRFVDFIKNKTTTVVTSTDEENNLLFDSSDLTTEVSSKYGVDISTISSLQFNITNNLDIPSYLKLTNGNINSDINYFRHNSKYFISLNTAATDNALLKGGSSVSIGKDIKFSLLFSNSDTPGNLLGFPNVGNTTADSSKNTTLSDSSVLTFNLGDTDMNAVQSNTIKTDISTISSSIKGSSQYSDYVQINTASSHNFETGDKVYIRNHSGSNNDNAVNSDLGYTIVKKDSTSFYVPIIFTSTTQSSGSTPNGYAFRKQLYKPFVLSGNNYSYLIFKNIDNITSTTNIKNIFAKILLSGVPGSILFNTYISSDKDYYDGLLNILDYLEIEIRDANGDLFEFNNADFSFSLEISEVIDIVQGTGVSSRTGQVESYLEVLEE